MAVTLGQPAMTEHIKMEAGRGVQVSFESKSFLLLVPDADKPLERNWARPQADGDPGVIKPVSRKTEAGLEQGLA